MAAASGDGLALPDAVAPPEGLHVDKGEAGFPIRLPDADVFFCLIDADRVAAAAFDAQARGDAPETTACALLSTLRDGLGDYMARRDVGSARTTQITGSGHRGDPFTSVIEQTARVYREALGALGDQVLEHHSAFDATQELRAAKEGIGPERRA